MQENCTNFYAHAPLNWYDASKWHAVVNGVEGKRTSKWHILSSTTGREHEGAAYVNGRGNSIREHMNIL